MADLSPLPSSPLVGGTRAASSNASPHFYFGTGSANLQYESIGAQSQGQGTATFFGRVAAVARRAFSPRAAQTANAPPVSIATVRAATKISKAKVAAVAAAVLVLALLVVALRGGIPASPENGGEPRARLPLYFYPKKYALAITADLDKDRFAATVSIELVPHLLPSDNITIHAINLDFGVQNVSLFGPLSITANPDTETVTILFPHALHPLSNSAPLILQITYTAPIGYKTMRGFFKSPIASPSIHPPKSPKFIAATHFEPLNARRAFPCFDEPQIKTLWTVAVAAKKGFTVVSNRAVEEVVDGDVGFAVDVATTSLHYYESYFNIAYPMQKLDLWPMPDFSGEAMENFGLCIFASSGLFTHTNNASVVDSDPDHLVYVSNLVAHEIAHHWVGDLVTMGWWSSLWLNEGFAEWAQWRGTNASFGGWRVEEEWFWGEHEVVFGREVGGFVGGVEGVVAEVEGRREVEGCFGELTYNKGASIIRMFEAFLEQQEPTTGAAARPSDTDIDCDPWCRVLRSYLSTNAFKTVSSNDLYNAIDTEDESGLVSAAMQGWIEKDGVPVVWVDADGAVRQE
ncbi:hypothetical protein HDU98_004023, partial [Podochytrium sp. JEL0797]